MKTNNELFAKYQAWFEITLFEHHAIKERRWKDLNLHEAQKQAIVGEVQKLESNLSAKETAEDLRLIIHQLADLEQLNQTLLQERMKETRMQLSDVQRRQLRLQQLRLRYTDPQSRHVTQHA